MRTCAADVAPNYDVAPGVAAALRNFRLPDELGFGAVAAPVMFSAEWVDGAWGRGTLVPYGPIEILPGARALQYAELVFEGLKAYKVGAANPSLFRPRENWQRLTRSAQRLSMPPVPELLFFEAVETIVGICHRLIPRESGRSLYLRPFLFGTEAGYLLRNSTSFRFMVIANPVEIYSTGPMRVAIERGDVRAAVGGLGRSQGGRELMRRRCARPMPRWREASLWRCGSTPASSASSRNSRA